jgi:hypothetical protein
MYSYFYSKESLFSGISYKKYETSINIFYFLLIHGAVFLVFYMSWRFFMSIFMK